MPRLSRLAPWLIAAWTSSVLAQGFPSRPVHLVVPFPPGGSTDVAGRIVAQKLGETWGQPVVVDNRPGAGTALAAEAVAKAAPDGYTLLLGSASTFSINPSMQSNLPYDALKSFTPIAMVGGLTLVLIANPSLPAAGLRELVAMDAATPGALSYASFGVGTSSHLAGEMLKATTGMKVVHVPYKGSSQAMNDLIGGQVALSVDTVVAAAPHIKAGKVKPIVVTTEKRSRLLPDVATVAESGYPGFHADSWLAVVAPAGTPEAIVKRLRGEFARALLSSDTADRLLAAGFEPIAPDPEAYRPLVESDVRKYTAVVKSANIKPE